MTQADRVLSTPRRTAPLSSESTAGCILADHFLELETPMRDLSAAADVVMTVWRHPELGTGKHADRMDVMLNNLELIIQGMVDGYRASLERKAV
jgi:hypothetical protein